MIFDEFVLLGIRPYQVGFGLIYSLIRKLYGNHIITSYARKTMAYKYSQLDVAIAQLDADIRLFLDDQDYFSSATLAGASDEVLGAMLRDKGEKSSLDLDADHLFSLLTDTEKDVLKT